jgi:hypothetical protein
MMTGSHNVVAYLAAFASASTSPAASSNGSLSRPWARTTSQVHSANRKTDIASNVANAPSTWTGPRTANIAAAPSAARRPNSRPVTA